MGERTPLEEAAIAAAGSLGIPPDMTMTEEQIAEFRERFDAEIRNRRAHILRPPLPPLTKDEVRQLLRECVTVVGPGETLVIRVNGLTPAQVHEYQDAMNAGWAEGDPYWPFRTAIVFGDGFGVAEGAPEVIHRCPPEGESLMPCCGLTPYDAPRTDRMTLEPSLVTCGRGKRNSGE